MGRLIISRGRNQSMVIGQDTVITVTEIAGNSVRLAFEGPASVPFTRLELLNDVAKDELTKRLKANNVTRANRPPLGQV